MIASLDTLGFSSYASQLELLLAQNASQFGASKVFFSRCSHCLSLREITILIRCFSSNSTRKRNKKQIWLKQNNYPFKSSCFRPHGKLYLAPQTSNPFRRGTTPLFVRILSSTLHLRIHWLHLLSLICIHPLRQRTTHPTHLSLSLLLFLLPFRHPNLTLPLSSPSPPDLSSHSSSPSSWCAPSVHRNVGHMDVGTVGRVSSWILPGCIWDGTLSLSVEMMKRTLEFKLFLNKAILLRSFCLLRWRGIPSHSPLLTSSRPPLFLDGMRWAGSLQTMPPFLRALRHPPSLLPLPPPLPRPPSLHSLPPSLLPLPLPLLPPPPASLPSPPLSSQAPQFPVGERDLKGQRRFVGGRVSVREEILVIRFSDLISLWGVFMPSSHWRLLSSSPPTTTEKKKTQRTDPAKMEPPQDSAATILHSHVSLFRPERPGCRYIEDHDQAGSQAHRLKRSSLRRYFYLCYLPIRHAVFILFFHRLPIRYGGFDLPGTSLFSHPRKFFKSSSWPSLSIVFLLVFHLPFHLPSSLSLSLFFKFICTPLSILLVYTPKTNSLMSPDIKKANFPGEKQRSWTSKRDLPSSVSWAMPITEKRPFLTPFVYGIPHFSHVPSLFPSFSRGLPGSWNSNSGERRGLHSQFPPSWLREVIFSHVEWRQKAAMQYRTAQPKTQKMQQEKRGLPSWTHPDMLHSLLYAVHLRWYLSFFLSLTFNFNFHISIPICYHFRVHYYFQVSDLIVLVIAADEGVKEQTVWRMHMRENEREWERMRESSK